MGCIICGSNEYAVLYKKNISQIHQIVKCSKCGLMYACPQVFSPSDLYGEENAPLSPEVIEHHAQYKRKQHNQLPDYIKIARTIDAMKPEKGRLLEIGPNLGVFLNYLKEDGWDTVGIEPDRYFGDYAQKYYNLNIHQTTLEESAFEAESLDVVIMLHVIEHLPDPASSCGMIHRMLKKGGVFVVETPKYDTINFKILGSRERSMRCDGHIYFFSAPALKALLRKSGFEIIKEEVVGRTVAIDRLLFNIALVSKSSYIEGLFKAISRRLHLEKKTIHLNMGDMQRVYCLKK
ncbi:MAG: hypothetical protein C0392_08290 [Syntrophus sp. (in: bacteria)]|nr:hypothetical protein [Syntrophus sp. (in: bacteria)]